MPTPKGFRTLLLFLVIASLIIVPFICYAQAIDQWLSATLQAPTSTRWVIAATLFGALALDIFLPVPSSLASTLCGQCFGLYYGFLLSFTAMTVSALMGYLIGAWNQPLARRLLHPDEYHRLSHYFHRHGIPTIIALRTVPVLAEASLLFAGLAHTPFKPTLIATLIGNAIVSLLYALVGAVGASTNAMLPAFAASLIISAILLFPFWKKRPTPPPHTP